MNPFNVKINWMITNVNIEPYYSVYINSICLVNDCSAI